MFIVQNQERFEITGEIPHYRTCTVSLSCVSGDIYRTLEHRWNAQW